MKNFTIKINTLNEKDASEISFNADNKGSWVMKLTDKGIFFNKDRGEIMETKLNDRKAFQPLSEEENQHFMLDGRQIYYMMKLKYPNRSHESLDNILNGICAALICLIRGNVDKDEHKNFLQLIWKILNKNL